MITDCQTAVTLSVVIPTHNRAFMLNETVTSVLASERQDLQLVVIDDASTDQTPALMDSWCARDPRVQFFRHHNCLERSATRNTGTSLASGEWILYLDDDDEVDPAGINEMCDRCLTVDDAVVAVVGGLDWLGELGSEHAWIQRPWVGDVCADCLLDPFIGPNRAAVRKSAAQSIGGWDTDLPPFEDWAFSLRIASLGPAMLLPSVVVHRRRHGDQSDLDDGAKVRTQIYESIISDLEPHAARRLARRRRVIQLIEVGYTSGGAKRIALALQAVLIDRTVVISPLARATVGRQLLRLGSGGLIRLLRLR